MPPARARSCCRSARICRPRSSAAGLASRCRRRTSCWSGPPSPAASATGRSAAAVYHSHPHRDEEFDLPPTMREQAVLAMENLKKTLEAAGCGLPDLVSATRFLTDVREQDDLNLVWADYLNGHLPTTTTVEVSRLATHPRCKIEISAIAVP